MSSFLGTINRSSKIPISLTLEAAPTGTPTYRIIDSAHAEVVAATSLTQGASTLIWYNNTQTVASDAPEGEFLIEYSAVVNGTTRYATDSYEVPQSVLTPTSGVSLSTSSNWTLTRDSIIKQALFIPGVIGEGQDPNANQIVQVSTMLNQYVKRLQVKHNVKLWKLVDDYKNFSAPSEVTGTDSSVYTCILSHTSSSASKPVTGADWSSYWIVKGSTGGVWADSTAYTSSGDFIDGTDLIGVEQAYLRRISTSGSHSDSEIEIVGHKEFYELSNRTSFGNPTRLHFDGKLSSPTIFLYPLVEDTDDVVLHYQKIMRVEDFDAAGNTADFPVHWLDHLIWKMAHKISIAYHNPISEQREYKREAGEALNDVLFDTTKGSQRMRISPKRSY